MGTYLDDGVDMEEFTADEVGGVRHAWYIGGRRHGWPTEIEIRGKVEARVPASMVLARVVAAVMPTSGRAPMSTMSSRSAQATTSETAFEAGSAQNIRGELCSRRMLASSLAVPGLL
jgi:hypothetical protein